MKVYEELKSKLIFSYRIMGKSWGDKCWYEDTHVLLGAVVYKITEQNITDI